MTITADVPCVDCYVDQHDGCTGTLRYRLSRPCGCASTGHQNWPSRRKIARDRRRRGRARK